MIPYLPNSVSGSERYQFYKDLLLRLEMTLQTHIGWYTHKNPYGCPICDLLLLARSLLNHLEDYMKDDQSNCSPRENR